MTVLIAMFASVFITAFGMSAGCMVVAQILDAIASVEETPSRSPRSAA